jgi:hypothetical protein
MIMGDIGQGSPEGNYFFAHHNTVVDVTNGAIAIWAGTGSEASDNLVYIDNNKSYAGLAVRGGSNHTLRNNRGWSMDNVAHYYDSAPDGVGNFAPGGYGIIIDGGAQNTITFSNNTMKDASVTPAIFNTPYAICST